MTKGKAIIEVTVEFEYPIWDFDNNSHLYSDLKMVLARKLQGVLRSPDNYNLEYSENTTGNANPIMRITLKETEDSNKK